MYYIIFEWKNYKVGNKESLQLLLIIIIIIQPLCPFKL